MTAWEPAADGLDGLPSALRDFWSERHLCSLTTLRPDGRPHVVPVGVVLDAEQDCAWVITNPASRKARNLVGATNEDHPQGGLVAACQVDGGRWATLEGRARVVSDAESVARAVQRYAARYRVPRENPDRVALRISVHRIVCSASLVD